ncbi:unannotated protein [freshwater metagenome]|uniref:Unannotated protein n=1 Tax=freshwater metagenome TaxID=449393 RepID=A0A6J7KI92_9ZZZZ
MGRLRIGLAAAAIVFGGYQAFDAHVSPPARDSVSRLDELIQDQNAYDKERQAGCLGEDASTPASVVRKDEQRDADGGKDHRPDEKSDASEDRPVRCLRDATGIANRIATEALRSSVATTYLTWFAGLVAILALLGALLSARYAGGSWLLDRDARRGRVGIVSVTRSGHLVTFDLLNVGEVPVIVHRVADPAGNAYRRSVDGWVHLDPGGRLTVTAIIVGPRLEVDVRFREYGGTERRTTAVLRPTTHDWVVGGLRERK